MGNIPIYYGHVRNSRATSMACCCVRSINASRSYYSDCCAKYASQSPRMVVAYKEVINSNFFIDILNQKKNICSGMLAIPMSAIRKYGPEIAAITLVAVVLGVFWSIIDSYQMWQLLNQHWVNGHYALKFSLTGSCFLYIFMKI